jgi:hypothetical protein
MDIHTVMARFAELEGAVVGVGPRKSSHPNTEIQGKIDFFLNSYPFLHQDRGYIDFLEFYAGAHVLRGDYEVAIDIFGFLDISTHMLDYEDPIVDEDGFLTFSLAILQENRHLAFGFDATQHRTWGVYRAVVDENGASYVWYCDTFLEWLNQIVQKDGNIL